MASLWTLPVIYVCENNLYNEYTHYLEATAGDILARPQAFGIEAREVDGQDVRAVYAADGRARRARARAAAARRSCSATPTATTATTSATSTARTTARRTRRQLWRTRARPARAARRVAASQQELADDDDAAARSRTRRAPRSRRGVQFALDAPFPDPSEVTEDVFA